VSYILLCSSQNVVKHDDMTTRYQGIADLDLSCSLLGNVEHRRYVCPVSLPGIQVPGCEAYRPQTPPQRRVFSSLEAEWGDSTAELEAGAAVGRGRPGRSDAAAALLLGPSSPPPVGMSGSWQTWWRSGATLAKL
jgi:hypothetical protein